MLCRVSICTTMRGTTSCSVWPVVGKILMMGAVFSVVRIPATFTLHGDDDMDPVMASMYVDTLVCVSLRSRGCDECAMNVSILGSSPYPLYLSSRSANVCSLSACSAVSTQQSLYRGDHPGRDRPLTSYRSNTDISSF
jgi:hypothetical protein